MVTIIEKMGKVLKPPYKEPQHLEVRVRYNQEEETEVVVMHEDEVLLLETLERLQKTANIYPESMNEIWKQIRKYARSEYICGNNAISQTDQNEV
jgi:hypothetical protein